MPPGFAQTLTQPQEVSTQRHDHVRTIRAIGYDNVYDGLLNVLHGIPPRAGAQVREIKES